MKKLRLSKQATGTKEEKKKATMALDAEIHKVLGPDYKKYRAVTVGPAPWRPHPTSCRPTAPTL